ncbi:hypothetical protein E2P81_ATG09750 [Venturia nashicola]|uniref:SnoaL-like domain-containing protein n=1 Tax=Venturia nashicola TaxID=86259 RepID=A0A4Z1NQU1_9PEZI|nr:hypothetical protein E6O75_ATG09963 [Venturia nashicola]TLD14760.1 hypothetical protein E2P81_ATG09750 [Venturia nashicola]
MASLTSYIQKQNHEEHQHISARLDDYIKAYSSGNAEAMMKFYHPTNFVYQDLSTNNPAIERQEFEDQYKRTFASMHDFNIKTLSVHGHKDFTAWEWEIICRPAIEAETGMKLSKEEATEKRLVGCTLMWWEDDLIVRNHDYVHLKET